MFGNSFKLFTWRGVEIFMDLTALFIIVFYVATLGGVSRNDGLLIGVAVGVLIIASILIHELAHAAVGMLLGAKVDKIMLSVIGGVCVFGSKRTSNWRDLLISLAGPASNFALWFIFNLSFEQTRNQSLQTTAWIYICYYVSQANLLLAIFNLLPGFPLDGGQALRALVLLVTRRELWAAWAVALGGLGVGGFFAFIVINDLQSGQPSVLNVILLGMLGYWIVSASLGQLQSTKQFTGQAMRFKRAPAAPVATSQKQESISEGIPAGALANRGFDSTFDPRTTIIEFLARTSTISDGVMIPVLRDGFFAGMLTRSIARKVSRDQQQYTYLEKIMMPRRDFQAVYEDDDLSMARLLLRAGRGKPVLVLDRGGVFIGSISAAELEKVRR
ncbi:MAG: M50 family metallopeptidase [Chloroflexi bacterium]|uniref:M50 family metallopeptidase n=1 Tax=Candidatus Chlorohelix allophototropha TaxID=3003348 RepID=A0A8T7M7S9_9CHLR|nr:M50 family metallopeptidase [Chloroflexota bacterium]WJW68073.1 M50 family metallopeptidase [Chloroflexota bacterium L227-S17]